MIEKYFFKELTKLNDGSMVLYVHESEPIEYLIMRKGSFYNVYVQNQLKIVYEILKSNLTYLDVILFFQH